MRIVDRFFGMIAAAGFGLGIVLQVNLLSHAATPDPFDALLVTFFATALTALGYITLRAERRHGLIDPADESINIIEVAYSLPAWAIAVSAILASYIGLIYFVVLDVGNAKSGGVNVLSYLPDEFSVLEASLRVNGLTALFASLFVFSSFVIAIYLLVREPIKEFH